MDEVSIIGVDLAKSAFHVHGASKDGRQLFQKKLTRLANSLNSWRASDRAWSQWRRVGARIIGHVN